MQGRKTDGTEPDLGVELDHRSLARAYGAGAYPELVSMLCDWIARRGRRTLKSPDGAAIQRLTHDLDAFFYYVTRPDLRTSASEVLALLEQHSKLTSLIAISDYETADPLVARLKRRRRASVPLLILSNVRNADVPDRKAFFDLHPLLASEWYGQYFIGVPGFANARVQNHLREHLQFWDDRMVIRKAVSNGFMRSTYIDPTLDRTHKGRFDAFARRVLEGMDIRNRPDGRQIGVITARWAPTNPTYKNRFPLFKALAEHYPLTLIHVGPPRADLETSIFSRVHRVWFEDDRLKSDFLFDNDLQMLFYPDIGMNLHSRFLCNLRLAPVQITTNSHPVSTFGSEIDYFITGADSEESPELAARHYQERLVLIPGIGTLPIMPTYVPDHRPTSSPLRIACPWGVLKYNSELLQTLRKIAADARQPVVFRFLSTMSHEYNFYLPFKRDLVAVLGSERVEFLPGQAYENYMDSLAECALALDSFPFGGNTSIIDCAAIGVPIVTRKGWQFYNMAGPVMVERLGLSELVTASEDAFVETATRLIDDPAYRDALQRRIKAADLGTILGEATDCDAFVRAISDLMTLTPGAAHDPLVYA